MFWWGDVARVCFFWCLMRVKGVAYDDSNVIRCLGACNGGGLSGAVHFWDVGIKCCVGGWCAFDLGAHSARLGGVAWLHLGWSLF